MFVYAKEENEKIGIMLERMDKLYGFLPSISFHANLIDEIPLLWEVEACT